MMKMGHCLHRTILLMSGKKNIWQGPSKNLRQYLDVGNETWGTGKR